MWYPRPQKTSQWFLKLIEWVKVKITNIQNLSYFRKWGKKQITSNHFYSFSIFECVSLEIFLIRLVLAPWRSGTKKNKVALPHKFWTCQFFISRIGILYFWKVSCHICLDFHLILKIYCVWKYTQFVKFNAPLILSEITKYYYNARCIIFFINKGFMSQFVSNVSHFPEKYLCMARGLSWISDSYVTDLPCL